MLQLENDVEWSKRRCFFNINFYSRIRLKKNLSIRIFLFFTSLKSPIKRPHFFFHCFFAISWLVAALGKILWRSEKLDMHAGISSRVSLTYASHR